MKYRLCVILLPLLTFLCKATAQETFSSIDEQLAYLVSLPEEELAKYDIAYLNLVCAQGLNGSEDLDIQACLQRLDEMARVVGANTQASAYMFTNNPASFDNSIGQFNSICMVTFAVKGFGVMYDPSKIETVDNLSSNDDFFADSKGIFLNGLLQTDQPMGTCSSLPVYWIALGRRLGYPLYMSNTFMHFFVRWDDLSGDRFNFEGSQNGCGITDDDHYKEWPTKVDEGKIEYYGLLSSFSRKEELMHFLIARGTCLRANKRYKEAILANALAYKCYPNNFSSYNLAINSDMIIQENL